MMKRDFSLFPHSSYSISSVSFSENQEENYAGGERELISFLKEQFISFQMLQTPIDQLKFTIKSSNCLVQSSSSWNNLNQLLCNDSLTSSVICEGQLVNHFTCKHSHSW